MTFGDPPPRRRPSLTPMIDVVFLLLVFFMLASRFGTELQLPLATAGGGPEARWSGPPRLVEVAPEALRLNGTALALDALPGALEPLVESPADTVILRPAAGAELQRLVAVMEHLGAAGFGNLVLVGEAP
ncbi:MULTISPECIES: ExbD/TolR family protein [unclassified Roseivivax]|uniref:ExbD/TolR family protein n=1 Tax=Roseivivax sp. GX 12232 TaxID=2900547 RepID=UPI001E39D5BF|nr:biopolymer transporter ExbD [Roseivivax sp. GX 12232]MCE0504015.1 biopolymer transporter ExbD [Roseivivax sp. GX 12232]